MTNRIETLLAASLVLVVGLGVGCSLRKFGSDGDGNPGTDVQVDQELATDRPAEGSDRGPVADSGDTGGEERHPDADAQGDPEVAIDRPAEGSESRPPTDSGDADVDRDTGLPDVINDSGEAGDVTNCGSDGRHACVEPAPSGWSGPMALATGSATTGAPSCTATGYERQVLSLFGTMNEGAATCACACDPPPGMACGAVPLLRAASGASCTFSRSAIPQYTLAAGTCTSVTSGLFMPLQPTFSTTGGCTAHLTANIAAAAWTRRMVACETNDSSPAGCPSSAVCIPKLLNPLQAWCVYRTGDQPCEGGVFTQRTVYYDGFTDTRSCTTCSCDTPTGSCAGNVTFTTGAPFANSCERMILAGPPVAIGTCGDITVTDTVVASPSVTPQGTCNPIGGSLQGSVATTGAVTVCCKP